MVEDVFEDVRTYYVFGLAGELYALDTRVIKGVKTGYKLHTQLIHNQPSFVVGMLEWGPTNIPVVDLRLIYDAKETLIKSQTNMIIVAEAVLNDKTIRIGLRIEGYLDIINIRVSDIKRTHLWEPTISEMFLSNRFSSRKQLIKILDPAAIWAEIERLSNISLADHPHCSH